MKQIDVLPDDVLLEIFDFYMIMNPLYTGSTPVYAWQPLVHVCRRWRNLVFGSPRRLKLRLLCTSTTPVKDRLDVWPALPLVIVGDMTYSSDNVIAALGQSNRVREVDMSLPGWQLEKVLAPMQVPFPELTVLQLFSEPEAEAETPVIPDSFLGGSAPRLQVFNLTCTPYPGLPKLLLSATHLVNLSLYGIPHSGYISPEAMVALLPVLSSLETLSLGFLSPQSLPDFERRSLPPPNRFILPSLKEFYFNGVTEYLEELVTCVDAPQLDQLNITLFKQINFGCPRLAQFINTPKLKALNEAHVQFHDSTTDVRLRSRTSKDSRPRFCNLQIEIEPDWQLSSIKQVCNSLHRPLSTVEYLYIEYKYRELVWKNINDDIEDILWLELLLPFPAAKDLYLFEEFAPAIVATLQELVGGIITATEVLPSLQKIFVEGLEPSGPFQENIGQLIATRHLSGYPITISIWDKDVDSDVWPM